MERFLDLPEKVLVLLLYNYWIVLKNKNKNKNKNNFSLHRNLKITNTSCQLFIDDMIYTIYTNIYRLHYDETLDKYSVRAKLVSCIFHVIIRVNIQITVAAS